MFWDRGLGELGSKLTELAHTFGETDAYVYQGEVHLSSEADIYNELSQILDRRYLTSTEEI